MADKTYQLQTGRYGENWMDEDSYPRDQSDLAAWIELGRDCDGLGGKYHYRIIDEDGNVMWTMTPPYEGVSINLAGDANLWLDSIRNDYGLDETTFYRACLRWIGEHNMAEIDNG